MKKSFQSHATVTLLAVAISSFAQPLFAHENSASADEKGAARLMQAAKPMPFQSTPQVNHVAHPARKPLAAGEPRIVETWEAAPSDAIVLFNGKDLSEWQNGNGRDARWKVGDGVLTVAPKTGSIHTKRAFGDCQLHIEWATPAQVVGDGQGRGNSGIFLQSRYEIQVLDSYNNQTYFDGQAGAVYKQHAPLVNASRAPGEWQVYDIIYHAPRFGSDGKVTEPATVTVLQNGVLVQDHSVIKGPTMVDKPGYITHAAKEPLELQDHGNPIRYRNIWIREL